MQRNKHHAYTIAFGIVVPLISTWMLILSMVHHKTQGTSLLEPVKPAAVQVSTEPFPLGLGLFFE